MGYRKGYIAPRHEDDDQSGCFVTGNDTCHVCGDSGEAGDVVMRYQEGDIMEITVQFTQPGYQTVNQFRICPETGNKDYSRVEVL